MKELATVWLGHHVEHRSHCASTMDLAAELAVAGAAHGTLVIADRQSAGRGRRGRTWETSAGGLALSVILRPALSPPSVPPITLAAGVGACRAVNSLGAGASLKWPNDLYVGDRKLGGILTEMNSTGAAVEHVVVGIGINLGDVPEAVQHLAVALEVDRDRLLAILLPELERALDAFLDRGIAGIRAEWESLARLQVPVRAGDVTGRAVGIGDTGALLVADTGGREHVISAGEIEWGLCGAEDSE